MKKNLAAVSIWAAVLLCGCDSLFNEVRDLTVSIQPLVKVPTGNFDMGWVDIANADTIHNVTLSDYVLGTTEITYDQWIEVCTWAFAHGYVFQNPGRQGGETDSTGPIGNGRHPVTNISWNDMIAWCNAFSEMTGLTPLYFTDSSRSTLYRDSSASVYGIDNSCVDWDADGYRLPTEAEWEYAARKTATGYSNGYQYSGYDGVTDEPGRYIWYSLNAGGTTHEVATRDPNRLGIFDMSGNVYELCWDRSEAYPSINQTDPHGADSGLSIVARGGSWGDDQWYQQTSARVVWGCDQYDNATGFRLARNAE